MWSAYSLAHVATKKYRLNALVMMSFVGLLNFPFINSCFLCVDCLQMCIHQFVNAAMFRRARIVWMCFYAVHIDIVVANCFVTVRRRLSRKLNVFSRPY